MARPKHADAEATRGRLLAAASTAFAERGRDGASIRAISGAAGVSLAMVSHYFGNKDGLYEACIEQMYQELAPLRDELLTAMAAAGDLEALLERAVRSGFRFARAHQHASRLLFRQLTVHGELDERRRETVQRPFLDAATMALGALTLRGADQIRLPLQSAVVLVARYGISSENELELFAPADSDSPLAAIEDHLVAAVAALLLPRSAKDPS